MRLNDALDALAPGVNGSVRLVRLNRHARRPSYVHGKVLLRIRRDLTTGVIVPEYECEADQR
ncbi:hypothetical protein ACFOY2_53355 [Nonomuraea purpurea]|uniref:Transposase n=1 Tax=Nonomuraea purpurea TaxID=1849276 RepID=A0ABV8GQ11_9ACTN